MTKVTEGEQCDRLTRERVGQVHANSGDVANVTATRSKVELIAVESLSPPHRLPVPLVAAAAGEGLRMVLRLPKIQNAATVRFLEIVGVRDSLGPISAFSVRDARYPGTGGYVPPVAERHSGADFHKDRFFRD